MCVLIPMFFYLALAEAPAGSNKILAELTEKGVSADDSAPTRLPAPTIPDGLDAEAQRSALAKLPEARHSPEQLLRKSAVAPFELQIHAPDRSSGRSGTWRVDVWFVVYGDLKDVANEDFLKRWSELSGGSDDVSRAGKLSAEEVQQRKLFDEPAGHPDEYFLYSTFDLFNRVRLSATRRAMISRSDESLLVAARVDPRFDLDEEYPNEWRPMKRDELGKPQVGQPHPYSGAGFYAKVTRLKEPEGALFVEYHQVFQEPKAWFGGANLLRSKLPLLAQDSVRDFRRKVMTKSDND
jgi:hypothetical protein